MARLRTAFWQLSNHESVYPQIQMDKLIGVSALMIPKVKYTRLFINTEAQGIINYLEKESMIYSTDGLSQKKR